MSITSPQSTPTASRIQAIDAVRGLVMLIMALDHVRDLCSPTTVRPEDVAQASALLFFTRWITHFCAPTFVFLSGVSIFLSQQKRPDRASASRFLLSRGLWLVFLEIFVINFLLQWGYGLILLQVIWAIGWSMVALAALLWLPRRVLAGLAVVIIAGHNLLPTIAPVTAANASWALLHNPPFLLTIPSLPPMLVAYSVGPWLGVMLAGYCLGPWFQQPLPQRRRRLQGTGAALLLGFVVLRATNWYGDPAPWSPQARGAGYSVLSFLNVTKYPPSLLYLCLTLGVALLLLSRAEQLGGWLGRVLRTYGQVPFFYYLLHWVLISAIAWGWSRWVFGQAFSLAFAAPKDWPAGYQPSLLRAYVVWGSVVLLTYWPCRWYQGYKQQHSYWWLSYL